MQKSELLIPIDKPNTGALRTAVFRELLRRHPCSEERKTLVDLGCGPCIFARIAAEAGYQVTAVDGRDERVPDELVGFSFVKSDARSFDISGFDVVIALGLMYHLEIRDQLDLLRRVPNSSLAIVDTQVHIAGDVPAEGRANLSELISEGGFEGVLYRENRNPMASIGNSHSFIHTPESQVRLFAAAGFKSLQIVVPRYVTKYGARLWYVGTKEKAQHATTGPSSNGLG